MPGPYREVRAATQGDLIEHFHAGTTGEGPTEVGTGSFTDTKRPAFTGQDIRFTTKGNALYAICLDWPGESVTVKSWGPNSAVRADMIAEVRMLGVPQALVWSQDGAGLKVKMPAKKPCDHAYTVKVVLKG